MAIVKGIKRQYIYLCLIIELYKAIRKFVIFPLIVNKLGKDFFNEDLNIDTFSSLFPDSSVEEQVLPE